jgi:hypothetical protein
MTDIIIEDWETMSWDFSNDVEDNEYDEDNNFQDEDEEEEYFKEPINLTLSLKRNILVLFQYVEKHGEELYKDIKKFKQ